MADTAIDSPDQSRGARLDARVSKVQKELFQRAAALSGRSLSDFVVASAQEAANRVIRDHAAIRLTQAEQAAFVRGLLKPAAPNARLRRAVAAYKTARGT